jgi:uncharacterized YigZ family protein
MTRYPIPASQVRIEDVILRSRFITTLAPAPTVDAARAFVTGVRAEFADATHNCWAYVVGAPGSTAQIGMSDDGEPAGTAGKPMLNVLLGSGVGDVAAVVTRYFGGAKLGTGGLVRAYSGGVKTALQQLPLAEKVERVLLLVILPYRLYQPFERLLPAFEAEVIESQFAAEVTLRVRLPVEHVSDWRGALRELSAGVIQVHPDVSTLRD